MAMKTIILSGLLCVFGIGSMSAFKYVGGDISELPTMENAKAKYFDKNGVSISDLITYSHDQGMNSMRVRLFVDPDNFNSTHPSAADQYACQDFEYILPICKRIKAAGMNLLLDFHYSDTWADPVKQWTPAAWESLSDDQLYVKIYEYTKEVLQSLKKEGVVPDFIQTGNEISYGMCWGPYNTSNPKKAYTNSSNSNLTRFKNLLVNAIKACREECPDAGIVLHTERAANSSYLTGFYDWARNSGLDYDIIGLSFYTYFHGRVSVLDTALKALENKNYGKKIWIVETGAAINWSIGDSDKQYYEPTDEGQNKFLTDLLECLDQHSSVTGLFWWEMDYNAYDSNLTDWYNGSLVDNKTGKLTSAFYTLSNWAKNNSGEDKEDEEQPEIPSAPVDYYLLFNQGGDWNVPGTIYDSKEDDLFTWSNIEIYQNGGDYGWFALTSVASTDWTEINSNRFGPSSNNEDPTSNEFSDVEYNNNSWQVPNGAYNLTFDSKNMKLYVRAVVGEGEDSDPSGIGSIYDEGNVIYFTIDGRKVKNPTKGIYIKVVNGKTGKVVIK